MSDRSPLTAWIADIVLWAVTQLVSASSLQEPAELDPRVVAFQQGAAWATTHDRYSPQDARHQAVRMLAVGTLGVLFAQGPEDDG